MSKVTQEIKSALLFLKFSNWLFGDSSSKDKLIGLCKKFDEIEQLDENNPEIKNLIGECFEEAVFFYEKAFYMAVKLLEDEKIRLLAKGF